jgi:hypothetical protein
VSADRISYQNHGLLSALSLQLLELESQPAERIGPAYLLELVGAALAGP